MFFNLLVFLIDGGEDLLSVILFYHFAKEIQLLTYAWMLQTRKL